MFPTNCASSLNQILLQNLTTSSNKPENDDDRDEGENENNNNNNARYNKNQSIAKT